MKTKYFLKVNEFVGWPKLADFKLIEEDIDENLGEEGETLQCFLQGLLSEGEREQGL